MKKAKIELIITSFLALALILFILKATNKAKKNNSLSAVPAAPSSLTNNKAELVQELGHNFSTLEKETANLELRYDPFTSSQITSKRIDATGISLKGVIWDKNKPMALINEEVVKVGDKIEGYTVKEIHKDRVILTDGANSTALKLE